ncbi:MAG: preprotein translocase subunit SecA [Planctomycetota bacterium]|nr:preprotein translocase subunit SecA [Planctomycetota bacterium]
MLLRRANELLTRTFRSPRHPPRRWAKLARHIQVESQALASRSDVEMRQAAAALRYRARAGESLDSLLPEAFACVVDASRRQLGLVHYQVQILGGIALHHGCIAEMQTGEGKTLVATLPVVLNSLQGLPVHVATANDYLAYRDATWMRPVYESLGLTVSAVTGDMSPADRRKAYDCDITYGTAKEFGFDFLRDQLTLRASGKSESALFADSLTISAFAHSSIGTTHQHQNGSTVRPTVQRHPLHFALIDEADSLLIDEARTPLIISSEAGDQRTNEALFRWCASAAEKFHPGEQLARDENNGQFELTPAGYRLVRALPRPLLLNELPMSDIADGVVRAAFVAESFTLDEHYVVRDGKVCIVDEYSGRIAEGRKWRNGIHQAVEARETLELTPLASHSARITVQELFSHYDRISGMTGTAATAACEFLSVYGLPVFRIPTRRPSQRDNWTPQVLPTSEARWMEVAREVRTQHEAGRPVLIGTRTIEQSERLSSLLHGFGIGHELLNARNHAREAEIVADAGQAGRVTVATNMAGRGTDICLQGDSEARGGLHVICGEFHSAARIDRQLIGRCARQGDPGSFRQFLSLEDDVLKEGLDSLDYIRLKRRSGESCSTLANTVIDFRRAQRAIERRHEDDRQLLLTHARQRARQLIELGQNPWLDAAQDD